jgi:hypothetical protein
MTQITICSAVALGTNWALLLYQGIQVHICVVFLEGRALGDSHRVEMNVLVAYIVLMQECSVEGAFRV